MSDRHGIDLGTTNSVMSSYQDGLHFIKNRQDIKDRVFP